MNDGFEFFGDTVHVKYLSAFFVGDDSFAAAEPAAAEHATLASSVALGLAPHSDSPVIAAVAALAATVTASAALAATTTAATPPSPPSPPRLLLNSL